MLIVHYGFYPKMYIINWYFVVSEQRHNIAKTIIVSYVAGISVLFIFYILYVYAATLE